MSEQREPRPLPAFYSEEQAAEYLGVAPSTLTRWRRKGTGPTYVRLSSTQGVRYLLRDLEDFVLGHRVTPGAPAEAPAKAEPAAAEPAAAELVPAHLLTQPVRARRTRASHKA